MVQGSQGRLGELDLALHPALVPAQGWAADVEAAGERSPACCLLHCAGQVYLRSRWRPRPRTAAHLRRTAKTHFSWITVRHPYERLLSAYR